MDEYISREEVFDEIRFQREYAEANGESLVVDTCDAMLYNLRKIKTADVEPVKHGRWIRRPTDHFYPCHCSVCDEVSESSGYKFCPYCGAIMDGESK